VPQENEQAIRLYEKRGYSIIRNLHVYYGADSPGYKMLKEICQAAPSKLRLNIPYRAQTLDFTCGPACMMMAIKYFLPQTKLIGVRRYRWLRPFSFSSPKRLELSFDIINGNNTDVEVRAQSEKT
jgi:hypothetical protein